MCSNSQHVIIPMRVLASLNMACLKVFFVGKNYTVSQCCAGQFADIWTALRLYQYNAGLLANL